MKREAISTFVSRPLVEPLRWVETHFSLQRNHQGVEGMEFEAVMGVGEPEIARPSPWVWVLRFPLPEPVGFGSIISWSFRRRYFYTADARPPDPDWIRINGNIRGFVVAADVTFECDLPPTIWEMRTHNDRVPGSFDTSVPLNSTDSKHVVLLETSDTRPDWGYGIAWAWDPSGSR